MKDTTTSKKTPIQKKLSKKSLTDIRMLFDESIKKQYWCEKQFVEILPRLAKLATSYELSSAILAQLAVSENQIIRLIHVFDAVGDRVIGLQSEAAQQILQNVPDLLAIESGFDRDNATIKIAEKLTELQIVNYEILLTLSGKLGEELASELLTMSVKEEKNVFRRITEINLPSIYFEVAS